MNLSSHHTVGLFISQPTDRRLLSSFIQELGHAVLAPPPAQYRPLLRALPASSNGSSPARNAAGSPSGQNATDEDATGLFEDWQGISLTIADYDAGRQYGDRILSLGGTTGVRYAPVLVLLPSSMNIHPWLDAGFDDVLRQPISKAELKTRLSVFLSLTEKTQQARALASALTLAEQQERHRIALALHDDLQQQLFAAQLRTKLAHRAAAAGDVEEVQSSIEDVEERLIRSIETTRTLSVDLSPPVLDGEGLTKTLEWLGLYIKKQFGLSVKLDAEQEHIIPKASVRILLFQVVRELLFNTAKHADVNEAYVKAYEHRDRLIIRVHDQGVGFDLSSRTASTNTLGRGLNYIQERLRLFGGKLNLESTPGEGTVATVAIPTESLSQPAT